jgi:hypothetical protein
MSIEAVTSAIGEDGIQIAVDALKEIASGQVSANGMVPETKERLSAAQCLVQYGLVSADAFGNPTTR